MTMLNANPTTSLPPIEWPDERGSYGEILPPPLTDGYTPEEALSEILQVNASLGGKSHRRKRGAALEAQIVSALMFVHQKRIRDVLAGRCRNAVEELLFHSVTVRGEPMSIRPPSVEGLVFHSFAPVLQNLTPGQPVLGQSQTWRLGLEKYGKTETFVSDDPAAVMTQAQWIYMEWSESEDEEFSRTVEKALSKLPPSMYHDYYLFTLERTEYFDFGDDFSLRLLGRHSTMLLTTPRGPRIITTDRGRAVRIVDALRRETKRAKLTWPVLSEVRQWLEVQGAPTPTVEWAKTALGLPTRVIYKEVEYIIVKREQSLVMFVSRNGRFGNRIAETDIEPPILEWLSKANTEGREALVSWMLLHSGIRELPAPADSHEHDDEEDHEHEEEN